MWSRLWLCSIVAAVLAVYHSLKAQAASSTGTASFLSNQLGRAGRIDEAQIVRGQSNEEEQQVEPDLYLVELAADEPTLTSKRLIKRSGISDQRLAEMQMMRALRKQLELRTSKQQESNSEAKEIISESS